SPEPATHPAADTDPDPDSDNHAGPHIHAHAVPGLDTHAGADTHPDCATHAHSVADAGPDTDAHLRDGVRAGYLHQLPGVEGEHHRLPQRDRRVAVHGTRDGAKGVQAGNLL